jgi:hypothetical protein
MASLDAVSKTGDIRLSHMLKAVFMSALLPAKEEHQPCQGSHAFMNVILI